MSETGMATGDLGRIRKSPEERKEILDRTLQMRGAQGWRIENRSDYQATIAKGKDINNILHFLLVVFTLGLWLVIWFLIGLMGGTKRRLLTVDEFGNVVDQKL